MRTYTALTRPASCPELVPEGFSLMALLFGPLWLAFNGAWAFAVLAVAIDLLLYRFAPSWSWAVMPVLTGLFGQDLRRAALTLRGFTLVHVVAARDFDTALGRLLTARPDLAQEMAR